MNKIVIFIFALIASIYAAPQFGLSGGGEMKQKLCNMYRIILILKIH